jgi:hypothetical protein
MPAVSATPSSTSDFDAANFLLSREIGSVRELWQEYKNGISPMPSVLHMNETYGAKWRASTKEAKFYYRRKIIYSKIEERISNGVSETEAVLQLESERGQRMLNKFAEYLKNNLE